jgi:hypothetical protein
LIKWMRNGGAFHAATDWEARNGMAPRGGRARSCLALDVILLYG